MINFDAVDFSERRPEEVISFFWRSVYNILTRMHLFDITPRYYKVQLDAVIFQGRAARRIHHPPQFYYKNHLGHNQVHLMLLIGNVNMIIRQPCSSVIIKPTGYKKKLNWMKYRCQ